MSIRNEQVKVTFYTEAALRAEFGDAYVDDILSKPFDNSPPSTPRQRIQVSARFKKLGRSIDRFLKNLEATFEDSKFTFEQRYNILSHPAARPVDVRSFNEYGHAYAKENGLTYNPIRIKSKGRDRARRRRAVAELVAKKPHLGL